MKEAPNKKMPPKVSTPTKMPNDEILSTLLRINNFDSISGLKDESLDIDLSACVTINSDLASMMNIGNSLSSTDFWRMLDESAQNTQFDITAVSDIRGSPDKTGTIAGTTPPSPLLSNGIVIDTSNEDKTAEPNFFSGIFLKPEPPVTPSSSPISKMSKSLPAEHIQHKLRVSPTLTISKISKMSSIIKQEPMEYTNKADDQSITNGSKKMASPQNLMKFFLNNATSSASVTTINESKDTIENYKCNDCEDTFTSEAELKTHAKTHRQNESRKDTWKKCPDCGKCLKLGSMWMHRKIHSDNKKYGCDICGQKFVQKINLTHHSRIHTAEKPYECPECQKRFQERSHLQRHQKYHAQTRSYRCDKCGKMYKTERCLKVHNLVHLEQRPFACNVCDKSFISNSKLKQHSNIHTGERPFKCNYCPRDFTNFPNWLKHTRRRHKVDHKTGEHLENIPSYCSKKSSKTTKPRKAAANSNGTEKPADPPKQTAPIKTNEVVVAPKTTVKRKKKAVNTDEQPPLTVKIEQPQATKSIEEAMANLPAPASSVVPVSKVTKPKRERKQSTPKQVQKLPITAAIKQEIVEPETVKTSGNNFADLHCLSITSAEELMMEQALEMEECGLYDAPVTVVHTDNAIAAEVAAAMHFEIKNEFSADCLKQEEIVPLKHTKSHLCSSLESSPFSSPASIELTQKSITVSSAVMQPEHVTAGPTFYMPSFSIDSQGTIVTTMANAPLSSIINSDNSAALQHPQQAQHSTLPSAQALINHLYLPMGMPLIVTPSNQALPPVDTLLFPAHATNGNFVHGKGIGQPTPAAQHNLS